MHLALSLALLQAAAVRDTVVMVQSTSGGWLQQILGVAQLGLLILAYVMLAAAVVGAFKMRNAFEQARGSLDEVGKQLRDIADNANRITASVTSVAETVKMDVASVHETIDYANKRARHAVGTLADRVDELNEAIAIVQDTAHGGLIKTIAAFRGVKAGMSAMRGRRKRRQEDRDEPGERETRDELPPDLPARPRLRRRARGDK